MLLKICVSVILLICYCSWIECVQPYFPPQIVFSPTNGQIVYGIDEINQRAFQTLRYGRTEQENSYVMKNFPYAPSDSPQSNYYVQLIVDSEPYGCLFETYWQYGGSPYNSFPSHWLNGSSIEVGNYIRFRYSMIKSINSSSTDEDYWYANETCQVDTGDIYPCEEIFFKKETDIPLRFTQVLRRGWNVVQVVTPYQIISIGKPDEKYFDRIPPTWFSTCRDVNLGLLYYPQTIKMSEGQSSEVQVWLISPPHRIHGNDTVIIQWKSTTSDDSLTWTPKQLSFNTENFNQRQILTVTRTKNAPQTTLQPIFTGGGFDLVLPQLYPIYVQ